MTPEQSLDALRQRRADLLRQMRRANQASRESDRPEFWADDLRLLRLDLEEVQRSIAEHEAQLRSRN